MIGYIVLADGFEEIEAVAVIDILRRAGVQLKTVSITGNNLVKGAHNLTLLADELFEKTNFNEGEMIVLPGGMPGTLNLGNHTELAKVIKDYNSFGKWIGAICAAPTVLAKHEIINGKLATCYPGCEKDMGSANSITDEVVVDGKIVTSRGPGTALRFGIKLVELTVGKEAANKLKESMIIE